MLTISQDDYYGNHGEFDTNDMIRAHMEDMEQMSNDATGHYAVNEYLCNSMDSVKARTFLY